MNNVQREEKKQAERDARRLFNEKYQAKAEEKETELQVGLGQCAKHKFDIYECGKFIGGITTSTWKCNTVRRSNNSGGQDRASAELLWLTLYRGDERRVMILTDEDMAERLFGRWQGCAFPHRIEIIHCDLREERLKKIGVL